MSLAGGLITTIPIIYSILVKSSILFLVFLFLNMVFSQWAWACLSTPQAELFPTGIRSTIVGLLVSTEGAVGALLTLAELVLTTYSCLIVIMSLWLAGTLAAAIWYVRGPDCQHNYKKCVLA